MERERVRPAGLGPEVGEYSHAFSVDARSFSRLVFISGQVAVDEQGHLGGECDVRAQFAQVFGNIQKIVEAAGGTMANIVRVRVYLARAEDLAAFNECRREQYPRLFPDGVYPPSTLVVVNQLVWPELLLEVEALAAL